MDNSVTLSAPVIGISGSGADSASVRAMMTQVASAGAVPVFLGNHTTRDADRDFPKIDALILMGNNRDIDPSEYGRHAGQHPKTKSELTKDDGTPDPEGIARRSYEFRMLELALESGMPVLGICGGMQRINVALGGWLHQHVPDLVGHEEHAQQKFGIAPFVPVQPITFVNNTQLAKLADGIETVFTPGHDAAPALMENSMHHQSVSVVGRGLAAAAFADDKVKLTDGSDSRLIEAIEADPNGRYGKQFLLGVQWHPEFSASPLGAKIAGRLSEEAKVFAQTHQRTHTSQEVERENIQSSLPQVEARTRVGSQTEMILKARALAGTADRQR